MASSSALITLIVVLGCAAAASAATFTVGEAQGWTTGQDYATWASGKTFAVGDKLVFKYSSQAHTVTEVSKSEYDACSSTNANGDTSGSTTLTLTAGAHYYICTIGSHCTGGMKLAVTAGDSSATPGTPTTPATPGTPTTPGTPAAGTPAAGTPASASARMHAGPAVLAAAAGVLVKLALF